MKMKISLACDHAGFQLKENLKAYLEELGHTVLDCGANSDQKSDYPDFGAKAAQVVSKGEADFGVLVCGTGIGMCMVANKMSGVRAAVLRIFEDAVLSRQHTNANVACLGGRINKSEEARSLVKTFLETPFEGGRHISRLEKVDKLLR